MLSIPSFTMGFAAGFGTGFISREIMSVGAAVVRPITKAAVKSSMLVFEKSRETLAHFTETLEDLVAEARSEVRTEVAKPAAAASAAGESLEAATLDISETIHVSEEPNPRSKEKHRAHAKKEHG